jgi:hypothetical protein
VGPDDVREEEEGGGILAASSSLLGSLGALLSSSLVPLLGGWGGETAPTAAETALAAPSRVSERVSTTLSFPFATSVAVRGRGAAGVAVEERYSRRGLGL